MSPLGEELPQRGGDRVNEIRHILERFQRRFTIDNPRLVERYVKGEASILLHFMVDGLAVEFVAYLQGKQLVGRIEKEWRKRDGLTADLSKPGVGIDGYIDAGGERAC